MKLVYYDFVVFSLLCQKSGLVTRTGISSGICLSVDNGEEESYEHIFPNAFFQI